MAGTVKGRKRLTLKGRLTIENAQNIHNKIKGFLRQSYSPEIYLTEIEETDISFIQILYSVLISAHATGKKVSFITDNQKKMESILINTGFESHFTVRKNKSRKNYLIEGINNGADLY